MGAKAIRAFFRCGQCGEYVHRTTHNCRQVYECMHIRYMCVCACKICMSLGMLHTYVCLSSFTYSYICIYICCADAIGTWTDR